MIENNTEVIILCFESREEAAVMIEIVGSIFELSVTLEEEVSVIHSLHTSYDSSLLPARNHYFSLAWRRQLISSRPYGTLRERRHQHQFAGSCRAVSGWFEFLSFSVIGHPFSFAREALIGRSKST